ncbi:MAG TPA: hypothetical protein VGI39_04775 [Polyangiaceae bacterium]|jgi:hypothetical protein
MPARASAPASAPSPSSGPLHYRELKVRHERYDDDTWRTLDDLYEGGFQLQKAIKNDPDRYLPRLTNEHADRYRDRCRSTAYINYFAQVIDYFTGALFTQELHVRQAPDASNAETPGEEADSPFYAAFAENVDGKGTKFAQLLKEALTTALKKRRALIALDFPRPPAPGVLTSRLDEEKAGLDKVFAYELPLEQVIDWDGDDDGGFRYLVIHRLKQRKAPPGQRTGTIVEEFKVWTKEEPGEPEDSSLDFEPDLDVEPIIRWRLYRVEYPPNKKPKDDDPIPVVDEGVCSFKRIPVLPFELPAGLDVGNKIALMQLEHYQTRSALRSAEQRNLVVIPFVKRGSEVGRFGGATPSETQQQPRRGSRSEIEAKGAAELGSEDDIGFAEPEGKAYEIIHSQITELKDEIFRVVHQMAASVSNAARQVARSGESKKEDRVAETIVLGEFGRLIRDFGALLYTTIAEARGEDTIWNSHGLDDYESEDREELLELAVSLDEIPIPSLTFKQWLKLAVAKRLCRTMPPETQDLMADEIEEGVKAEETMRTEAAREVHEATLAGLKAGADGTNDAAIPPAKKPKQPAIPGPGGRARGGGSAPAKAGGSRGAAALAR